MQNTLLQFLEEDYNLRMDCKLKSLLKQYTVKEIVAEIMSWILEKKTRYIDILNFARDFYIGSDLTKKQGEAYYAELEWQGFFSLLNSFLYDDDAQTCSWTVYTIGKFSRKENTHFLETAYETNFKLHHPMLAARCLFEMRWLESDKVEGHLETLKSENTLFSKMTLLYFYEPTCDDEAIRNMLKDKDLTNILFPKFSVEETEIVEIDSYLWAFEVIVSRYCTSERIAKLEPFVFENLVKTNFAIARKLIETPQTYPMKYIISLENEEEYGMGGPYAGDCYAVDKHGVKTFLASMVMFGAKQFGHQIFIPIYRSLVIVEKGQQILHRTSRLAVADMYKMELQIWSDYYASPLEIHSLSEGILKVSMYETKPFEVELSHQIVVETRSFSLPK